LGYVGKLVPREGFPPPTLSGLNGGEAEAQ